MSQKFMSQKFMSQKFMSQKFRPARPGRAPLSYYPLVHLRAMARAYGAYYILHGEYSSNRLDCVIGLSLHRQRVPTPPVNGQTLGA